MLKTLARRPSRPDPRPAPGARDHARDLRLLSLHASQYAYLNEVILLERSPRFRQFKRSRTLSRGFEGDFFVRWLGQLFLGTTFAFCFWIVRRRLGSTLIGNELTWYNPGMSDSERRAVSGRRLDRGRVLRRLSLLFLHRPADPARGLGARSATQGGGPRPGGESRLMPAFFYLWRFCFCSAARNRPRPAHMRGSPVAPSSASRPRTEATAGDPAAVRQGLREGNSPGTIPAPTACARSGHRACRG